MNTERIVETLQEGGIVCMPSDTIYGLFVRAEDAASVERLYKVKKRDIDKPCIALISTIDDVLRLGGKVNGGAFHIMERYWPGAVSVIVPAPDAPRHISRGASALAFRMPHDKTMQQILKQTGPLLAPSANPQGDVPAHTIDEARVYFGDEVDLYVDGGYIDGDPSTLIDATGDRLVIKRAGAVRVSI